MNISLASKYTRLTVSLAAALALSTLAACGGGGGGAAVDPPVAALPAAPTVKPLQSTSNKPTVTGVATMAAGEVLTVRVETVAIINNVKFDHTFTVGDGSLAFAAGKTTGAWSLKISTVLPDNAYNITAVVTNIDGKKATDKTINELIVQTNTAVLTYPAGSPEGAAYDYLNAARTSCGFGSIAPDAKLNVAAVGQADYETMRWNAGEGAEYVDSMPHMQTPGKTGFTGATFNDRLDAAGFSPIGTAHEDSVRISSSVLPATAAARSVSVLKTLMGTVYHLGGVMALNPSIGIGYEYAADAPAASDRKATLVLVNAQHENDAASIQTDAVVTYPCAGSTVNGTWSTREVPNPLPADWTGSVGAPLYIRSAPGSVLTIATHAIAGSQGTQLVLTKANDPNRRLGANEAFILLQTPLADAGSYGVSITGTVDGVAFTKTFTFATE